MREKVVYLTKRIFDMDYKRFFNTIDKISKKSKKSKIFLFFDMIYCGMRFQSGYLDYENFEMYKLNNKQRKTFLTRGINNHFVKKYNNPNYTHYFINKNEFNQKFDKFLKRDWLLLNGKNEKEFIEFIKNKKEIIAKPINGTHGDGVTKIKPNKSTYKELMQKKLFLVEEVVEQIDEMNKLNPNSVNTVRVITVNDGKESRIIIWALRIGNKNIIDNFNGGGMVVPINEKTRTIEFPAVDKNGTVFYKHPVTNTDIVGFKIPQFEEIEKLVLAASKVIPQVAYVGWDVALSINGPCLIEGNEFPSHDLYQLPPHQVNGIGVLPQFLKVMKK